MKTLATQDIRKLNDQDIVAISVAATGRIQSLGANINRLIRTWARRSSERRALAQLDERMLMDIGLSRIDIAREARKYCWQQ